VMVLTAQCGRGGEQAAILQLGGSGARHGSYGRRWCSHRDMLEEEDEERAGRARPLRLGGPNAKWAGKAIWAG
jgi:hypothetical protein